MERTKSLCEPKKTKTLLAKSTVAPSMCWDVKTTHKLDYCCGTDLSKGLWLLPAIPFTAKLVEFTQSHLHLHLSVRETAADKREMFVSSIPELSSGSFVFSLGYLTCT